MRESFGRLRIPTCGFLAGDHIRRFIFWVIRTAKVRMAFRLCSDRSLAQQKEGNKEPGNQFAKLFEIQKKREKILVKQVQKLANGLVNTGAFRTISALKVLKKHRSRSLSEFSADEAKDFLLGFPQEKI